MFQRGDAMRGVAECPAACDLCTNAGLAATPAPFELDYVCRGKLQPVPAEANSHRAMPDLAEIGSGFMVPLLYHAELWSLVCSL